MKPLHIQHIVKMNTLSLMCENYISGRRFEVRPIYLTHLCIGKDNLTNHYFWMFIQKSAIVISPGYFQRIKKTKSFI